MDYSTGAECFAEGGNLPTLQFSIDPNSRSTFTMYLIDVNAVSPATPLGDENALGTWLLQQPPVTIEGNSAGGAFWGKRVILCQNDDTTTTRYFVPAGNLPANITTGASNESCSPQLTPGT
jgi:hypothetical protein